MASKTPTWEAGTGRRPVTGSWPKSSRGISAPIPFRSNQHFSGRRMAEKCRGARGEAVGARLKHDDEIADLGFRHLHAVGEQVERRAQRADHAHDFALAADYAVAHHHGIILPYDLPEISGRSQVVVQAPVGYQEYLPPRDLAVDDAADINARFADQVAAQFDHDLGLGQASRHSVHQPGEIGAYRSDIEGALARKVRNAEAAADIEQAHGRGRVHRELERELDRLLLS